MARRATLLYAYVFVFDVTPIFLGVRKYVELPKARGGARTVAKGTPPP